MIITKPADFIKSFIEDLNNGIKALKANAGLTPTQMTWLGFCLIIVGEFSLLGKI